MAARKKAAAQTSKPEPVNSLAYMEGMLALNACEGKKDRKEIDAFLKKHGKDAWPALRKLLDNGVASELAKKILLEHKK